MATAPSPRRRERIVDRDSVLRASILDTALELGIGDSSAVAKWMFSPVHEVDEDVESMVSPSLTYASTATSEESAFFGPNFMRHRRPGAGTSASNSVSSQPHSLAKSDFSNPDSVSYTRAEGLSPGGLTPEPTTQRAIHFDLSNTPEPRAPSPLPPPVKNGKLRKARPDGYESDGGYVSDSTKAKKDKKAKSKKKVKGDGSLPGDDSDGGYLSEVSFKKKKEKKKSKDKVTPDKSLTDGESDGGYMSNPFSRHKKERAAAKAAAAAVTSPTTGDESDGAYLSESSVKKRSRFFRLNTKSSKRKPSIPDIPPEVPPVPSLPSMQLRIADMFSRSATPGAADVSRTVTPAPSERTVVEPSNYAASMSSIEPASAWSPLESPKPIPNAFQDAESVRTPSTDLLATFGRRPLAQAQSPTRMKAPSLDTIRTSASSSMESPAPAKPTSRPIVPVIAVPKPKKNPSVKSTPQISAPNTRSLAPKHTPVPLILTPPTPVNALTPGRAAMSSSPPDRSVTPSSAPLSSDTLSTWNRTPDVPRSPSSMGASPLPSPTGQNIIRPHVLAYYDLPPPSPPPSGPLPRTPPPPPALDLDTQPRTPRHDWSQQRAPSPIWKTDHSPGRSQLSGTTSPLFLQRIPSNQRGRESPFPVSPTVTPPAEEPLYRTTSNQRGRESPFPVQPVLPREESAELVRRTSVTHRQNRAKGTRPLRIGNRTVNISGPMSADAFSERRMLQPQQNLGAHWQPRSASALDMRPSDERDDHRRSWIEYEEENSGYSSRRTSSDELEPSLEGGESLYTDEHSYSAEQAAEDDARSTQFFDAEGSEEGGHRYSVWSAKSRVSILDRERSGDVRQQFVQRVEAMYGKSAIPPVPKLPPSARPGMF